MNPTQSPVIAVERSGNRKLGDAAATYVAQASCPQSCAFLGAGCYAEGGRMALHTRLLNQSPVTNPAALAVLEASAIGTLSGRRPLRLHVVGDAQNALAAATLADAASKYRSKQGTRRQPVWTYTHAWRDIARRAWRSISVLASCETLSDVRRAMRKGYAAALVVAEHPADGRAYRVGNITLIPCPEQTRGRTCTECRLCFNDTALRKRRAVITFAAHGQKSRTVREKVSQ